MVISDELKRKPGESIDEYLLRLGSDKDKYGIDWCDIRDLMNAEVNEDFSESKWRKDYHLIKRGYELAICKNITENEILKELEDKKIEFQKEKYRLQDQKREYNKIIRLQARFEHLKEEIEKNILQLSKSKPLIFTKYKYHKPTKIRANVLLSDWHYGLDFTNSLNTYNPLIFRERIEILVSKIKYYGQKHEVNELTIAALGDLISGIIHVSTRVEASEDVIKQIIVVAETLSEMIAELSNYFMLIRFINVIGNHARVIPDKTQSIFTENLEHIIPFYLESRLKDFENVIILKDRDGYFIDDSFDPAHVYVHGDLDHVSNMAKNLPQVIGIVPSYIFSGHVHHDSVKEYGRTKVITNGSLVGVDSYAMSNRFYSEPMQKMHIFDDKGKIEYTINIIL